MSLFLVTCSTLSAEEKEMINTTEAGRYSDSVSMCDSIYGDSIKTGNHEVMSAVPNHSGALFSLKTNALLDVVLGFNGELEVPIGRNNQWSLMAEYWCPWMAWNNDRYVIELQTAGLELRYWFGKNQSQRKVLTGWFGGVYYANGKYDFEWNYKGDQGEFNTIGATIGYSWSIHRRWNLELSASVGHLWGPRRHYEATEDGSYLLWQYSTTSTYTGPTKLKLSFVWLIGHRRQNMRGGGSK